MGTKTKADYAKQIAQKEKAIAREQGNIRLYTVNRMPGNVLNAKTNIAQLKAEIRALKAEMKTAPKG